MARLLTIATLAVAHATASIAVDTTAYCQTGRTASGQWTRPGIAAANWLRLGTRIRISPPAFGRSLFVVMDRIGWGTSLDLWTTSCSAALQYGRRLERVTVLGR